MFDNLSDRLSGILDTLTRRGALRPEDVDAALREVGRALLEADVSLDVARAFIERGGAKWHLGKQADAIADMQEACRLGSSKGCADVAKMKQRSKG